jgi:hypothetical protein
MNVSGQSVIDLSPTAVQFYAAALSEEAIMSKSFWRRPVSVSALTGAALFFANTASADTFVVTYEGEAAGVQNTTASFSVMGVEGFDSQTAGTFPQSFTTNFGTSGAGSTITGIYNGLSSQGIQINAANKYGGADGHSNYIVAFRNTPYSLTLSSNVAGGVNYFGFWLSALDAGNYVTFYDGDDDAFTFDPQDVLNAVKASPNPSLYYGNPNPLFKGQDSGEPFIFLNFFDTSGSFDKVVFNEVGGGGYESDNHTVGHYTTMGDGTVVSLDDSSSIRLPPGVPEPSSYVMMLAGFAALGFAGHRRTKTSARAYIPA